MDICLLKLLNEHGIKFVAPQYTGDHSSNVNTQQGSLNLVKTVSEVMNKLCLYFGSDLQGRINGTRQQYDFKKCPPIIISEVLKIVAFQLPSMLKKEYIWIFDLNYKIEENREKKQCKLKFDNGYEIEVPLTRQSIDKQRDRAIHILYKVTNNAQYGGRLVGHLEVPRQIVY